MESSIQMQRKALRKSIQKYVAADVLDKTAHLRKVSNRMNIARNFSERNKQR